MRKIISTLLVLLIVLTALPGEAAAEGAESGNLEKVNTYSGQFADVASKDWYARYVQLVYEYGLIGGVNETSFAPNSSLSVAEALAIACRLHSLYAGTDVSFPAENPWYQPYVDYAQKNGILTEDIQCDPVEPVTRGVFALFIHHAVPETNLPQINTFYIPEIPDVTSGSPVDDAIGALITAGILREPYPLYLKYSLDGGEKSLKTDPHLADICDAVYCLYDAGVLTGNDKYGTFTPNASITRGAVATILSRVVDSSLRQQFTLEPRSAKLVPIDQLDNLKSLKKGTNEEQFAQAYAEAKKIVEPLANLNVISQVCGSLLGVNQIYQDKITYSMSEAHYSDPYGFFILNVASCAGRARALGLCLNMLGIPYEHINENKVEHQWVRVNVIGVDWDF